MMGPEGLIAPINCLYSTDRAALSHAPELLETYSGRDFYVETNEVIDVWRLLQGARDIPAWMQGELKASSLIDREQIAIRGGRRP